MSTPRKRARRSVEVCEATTFGGRARVVEATALTLVDVWVVDTGPLPLAGGSLEDTLLSVELPGVVDAGVASAATKSVGASVQSDASIAGVNLLLGGAVVTAAVLTSEATAACAASGATTSGSSTVTGLRVGGITVTVTGAPNQVVVSGLVRLVLNEQVVSGGNIVVRALHASVLGSAVDVILSEADAQVTCACQTENLDAGGDSARSDDAGGGNDSGPSGTNDSGPPGSNDSGPPGSNDSGPPGSNDSGSPGSNDSGLPGTNDSGPPGSNDSGPPGSNDSGSPGSNDSGLPGTNDSGPPGDSGPRCDGHANEDGGYGEGGSRDSGQGSDSAVPADAGSDSGISSDSGTPPHPVVDGSADPDGGVRKPPHTFDAAVPPMTCDNDNPCPSSYTCVASERLQ